MPTYFPATEESDKESDSSDESTSQSTTDRLEDDDDIEIESNYGAYDG